MIFSYFGDEIPFKSSPHVTQDCPKFQFFLSRPFELKFTNGLKCEKFQCYIVSQHIPEQLAFIFFGKFMFHFFLSFLV